MSFPNKDNFIAKGRPGGSGGNQPKTKNGDRDAIRKSRPDSALGKAQSTGVKDSDRGAIRKSRPKSSGSGQSTSHK